LLVEVFVTVMLVIDVSMNDENIINAIVNIVLILFFCHFAIC